jgi:deoxyribodipyrimidine photo-lyase
MQQAQRAVENHALEYAIFRANQLKLPVVVGFGLTDTYPEANLRHYTFMLEGLLETAGTLAKRGIPLVCRRGEPPQVALALAREAALLVCDVGYCRHQKSWRTLVGRQAPCPVVQVESDVVVPVAAASPKAEYAARTLRPKLQRLLPDYLVPPPQLTAEHSALGLGLEGLAIDGGPAALLAGLNIDRGVAAVSRFFPGGTTAAKERFERFLTDRLCRYNRNSNQPQTDDVSGMSPYLHFGQVSPLYLALTLHKHAAASPPDRDAYLEELIVRRELAVNFVHHTPAYDHFACLPDWARKTLADHAADPRPHLYDQATLEAAETHDPYWNAAMQEMRCTGFMHNYMRMYWGKKVLEWSPSPAAAFETLIGLNNRYFLDGRDPNSFAGVAWIFGLHDRAWPERAVFGKVRSMTAAGLERKCDIRAYAAKVSRLAAVDTRRR